ncbi:MAG: holo-ACP synthase [Candidatus Promineifilaceae bacterium]|nr:holo-ACP synthase [Candidatus Promineifilaceae bacterium]
MVTTGIDLIEIERIDKAQSRHGTRFYERFFTSQEQAFCGGDPARLAGRFAVKEAVAKALGTGIGDFNWTDIEVVCDQRGKPELILHNRARELAQAKGLNYWSISISHSRSHAIGMAVALAFDVRDVPSG